MRKFGSLKILIISRRFLTRWPPLKRKNPLTRQIKNSSSLREELSDLAGFCEKNHLPCQQLVNCCKC